MLWFGFDQKYLSELWKALQILFRINKNENFVPKQFFYHFTVHIANPLSVCLQMAH